MLRRHFQLTSMRERSWQKKKQKQNSLQIVQVRDFLKELLKGRVNYYLISKLTIKLKKRRASGGKEKRYQGTQRLESR